MIRLIFVVAFLSVPGLPLAQNATALHEGMQHGQHMPGMSHEGHGINADAVPAEIMEGGQSAFAAIQEIVAQLMADPTTDWSRVDTEALRQHLIDMDNVTLRAQVDVQEVEGGARFEATDLRIFRESGQKIPSQRRNYHGKENHRRTRCNRITRWRYGARHICW
jgi:hypothetical protein